MLYCKSRTGRWSTHRVDPRSPDPKKTLTGIPLYTLEEATQLGYQPPTKPTKTAIPTGQNLVVNIHDRVTPVGEGFQFGTVTYQDGSQEPLCYTPHKATQFNTYRKKGATPYTTHKIELVRGVWTNCLYENGERHEMAPIKKWYTRLEMADQIKHARSELADQYWANIHGLLDDLCPDTRTFELHGKERTVQEAPKHADAAWLQPWLDRRINRSEKAQELYRFYQEWKTHRFEGDQEAFRELEEWATQDSHLVKIEEQHRNKWQTQRNDTYHKIGLRLVRMSKGGSLQVSVPPLDKKGQKATKALLATEEQATAGRRLEKSIAPKTFVAFLVSCGKREGIQLEVTPRAPK